MLKKSFFKSPTLDVARRLIGKTLIRKFKGKLNKGIITETEAYVGPQDLASHASRGRTARTAAMFGEAGRIYVYLIYGMHFCLNIVTEKKEFPAAVLIRAIRAGNLDIRGPGRITKYFHIDKSLNAKKLGHESGLWIAAPLGQASPRKLRAQKLKIKSGARIGVEYAGAWASKPWRFYVKLTAWRGL